MRRMARLAGYTMCISGRALRSGWLGALLLAIVGLAAGCGDHSGVGKTYPVTGKVLFNNQPLVADNAVVLFKPDPGKGNTSPFEPSGTVDDDGNYSLLTNGKEGAPAGWYKIIVAATAEPPVHPKAP